MATSLVRTSTRTIDHVADAEPEPITQSQIEQASHRRCRRELTIPEPGAALTPSESVAGVSGALLPVQELARITVITILR